jgi:hypothetical protein
MGRQALLLLAALWPAAAGAETDHDEQTWVNVTLTGSIKDDLLYFAEAQPRIGNGVTEVSQLLLRPAIGWRVSPRVSIYQGYARILSPEGRDRRENRLFQQLSWTLTPPGAGVEVQSRTRLEQRWQDGSGDAGHRLRQMVRFELPLKQGDRAPGLLTHAEGFFALNNTAWGARKGFDQLRAFGGVELPVDKRSTVELGYLAQVVNQPAGVTRWNHVAAFTFFLRP